MQINKCGQQLGSIVNLSVWLLQNNLHHGHTFSMKNFRVVKVKFHFLLHWGRLFINCHSHCWLPPLIVWLAGHEVIVCIAISSTFSSAVLRIPGKSEMLREVWATQLNPVRYSVRRIWSGLYRTEITGGGIDKQEKASVQIDDCKNSKNS